MYTKRSSVIPAVLLLSLGCARSGSDTVPSPPVARASPPSLDGRKGACSITLGSNPWAEVWIDGRNTGRLTPVVGYRLPCGQHRITLRNSEAGLEKTKDLLLRSGRPYQEIITLF
jgi:hypothetical protein